jgi:homoserine O-acetyltransferase
MPSATDLYFRVADSEAELGDLKHGTMRVIPSVWGHMAGNPNNNPDDETFIREATRDWLGG